VLPTRRGLTARARFDASGLNGYFGWWKKTTVGA